MKVRELLNEFDQQVLKVYQNNLDHIFFLSIEEKKMSIIIKLEGKGKKSYFIRKTFINFSKFLSCICNNGCFHKPY